MLEPKLPPINLLCVAPWWYVLEHRNLNKERIMSAIYLEQEETNTPTPSFVKMRDDAIIPTLATSGSAGYDLRTPTGVTIHPKERLLVSTGIGWKGIPECVVGLVWPKSGLANKYGIDTLAGVIDSDYEGTIGVILINHGEHPHYFAAGDAIAQLVLQRCMLINENDKPTEERTGGYGSTGK